MVLDANHSTLMVFEPLVQEIELLAAQETITNSLNAAPTSFAKNVGAGGVRFQYKFDPRTLSIIHTNAICRIYGDQGQEMLSLLHKNPTKAIPVIYGRLAQKDKEFRAAREHLNKRWKELAEHNYQKSLDHRSFYFRQADKKLTGTRALVSELLHAALDLPPDLKHKKTMVLKVSPEVPAMPKVYKPPPHLKFSYPGGCDFAHRDAFRLIMFAVEKSQLSPSDKERAGRMWRDFLGPFFGLCSSWLYSDAKLDKVPESASMAIPPGALVATTFGEGVVEDYSDGKYKIKLKYAMAYLHPTAVYCSTLPTEKSLLYDQYSAADEKFAAKDTKVVVGTQALYVFLRLHLLIVERLKKARELSKLREGEAQVSHPSIAIPSIPAEETTASPEHTYETFMSLLYNNLESHGDSNRYEAQCRQLLGNNSYELYTMDKLVVHAYKQLKLMGDDEILHHLIQVFRRYNNTGNFKPEAMRNEASHWSSDELFFINMKRGEEGGLDIDYEYIETLNEDEEEEEKTPTNGSHADVASTLVTGMTQ